MKNLHAFALEYIEAFYPLILILITYICIKLHDHNFRPVVLLWKPFHRCFVYFRRSWDTEASVISAFSTFLLLSFSKILFVTYTLLYGITAMTVDKNGSAISTSFVMYYDPTVQWYSEDHLPFAGVSFCVGLLFIVFPRLYYFCFQPESSGSASLVVNLGGGMHYTLLWKHFRDSTRMEPIVHETSEWFLHCT